MAKAARLRTLQEHLVLDHDVEARLVLDTDSTINLNRHQELHPDPEDDDHAARRHVHMTGQRAKDCFICSGPRY